MKLVNQIFTTTTTTSYNRENSKFRSKMQSINVNMFNLMFIYLIMFSISKCSLALPINDAMDGDSLNDLLDQQLRDESSPSSSSSSLDQSSSYSSPLSSSSSSSSNNPQELAGDNDSYSNVQYLIRLAAASSSSPSSLSSLSSSQNSNGGGDLMEIGGSNYLNKFHKLHGHKKPNLNKKKIFKADKNLQRLEKKSWKIPIKSVGLLSENSKDTAGSQKFMDEMRDLFDSFKDS